MNLQSFIDNMLAQLGNYLPGIIGALIVLFIGWLIARGLQSLTKMLLKRIKWDDRFKSKGMKNSSHMIARLIYYITMVMVLLIVLEMLGVSQVLDPLRSMLTEFLAFLPNLVAALLIGIVGYIIASVAAELAGAASKLLERVSGQLGLSGDVDLVQLLRNLVFLIVFIPVLIAALDALEIEAVSVPAKNMLDQIFAAIPEILAAAIIIGLFYVGGRYLMAILRDLLKGMGTDNLSERLKLNAIIGKDQSLSGLLAGIAFFFLMFVGIITGVERLDFVQLTDILNNLLELTGQVFLGLIILAVGNYLASLAADALSKGEGSNFLASLARFAILGVFLAIALRTMGIANEIVNLAFGLTLGAVAVAFALSFGLGGREAAGKHMEYLLKQFRGEDEDA
ncbi:MAG: mechanosensitive ion channel [Phaeodactylibacter sp.]|nr:mechanosensitive ion channel [Phaeodactylibacter sp.]